MITYTPTKRSQLSSNDKQKIMDKVREEFPKETSILHDISGLAWELLYNHPCRDCAVIVVIRNGGYEIGIADNDRKGYTPTFAFFENGTRYDTANEVASWINTNVLQLTDIEALEITLSSMSRMSS